MVVVLQVGQKNLDWRGLLLDAKKLLVGKGNVEVVILLYLNV